MNRPISGVGRYLTLSLLALSLIVGAGAVAPVCADDAEDRPPNFINKPLSHEEQMVVAALQK